MKKLQKLLALVLSLSVLMSFMSVSVFADDSQAGIYGCSLTEHIHGAACYEQKQVCEKQWDLTCEEHTAHTAGCYAAHIHTEGCSYEMVCTNKEEHVCTDACEKEKLYTCGIEQDLICTLELHTHSEEGGSCYAVHIHSGDAGCYEDELVCTAGEHTHSRTCLTVEAEAEVAAVEALIEAMPGLQEMKDARTSADFNVGLSYQSKGSDEDNAANQQAYMDYLTDGFAAREVAQAAYDTLPSQLQAYVANAAELEEAMPEASLNTSMSASIPAISDSDAYAYRYSGNKYEWSLHDNAAGNSACSFILVDRNEYGGETWRPDGVYVPGESNYVVVYCCDVETGIADGTNYKRINLEDADYYSDEVARQIRALVMSSYPFISANEMRALLKEGNTGLTNAEIDAITESEMLAATQFSIWSYANSESITEEEIADISAYGNSWNAYTGGVYHDLGDITWRWWRSGNYYYGGSYNNYYEDVDKSITAMVNYLRGLEGVAPEEEGIVISDIQIVGEPVLKSGNVYQVAVKVTLNSSGSSDKDELKIVASSGNGSAETDVVLGTTEYVMTLSAAVGETIAVKVSGTQHLPTGAYFYEPAARIVDGEVATESRDVSQNLVGVAMGDTEVSAEASFTLKYTLPETGPDDLGSASVSLKKVNESGRVLTGAEFTLGCDLDGDGAGDPIKTYAVNDNGELLIEDLLPGQTYTLTETKAPEGYRALSKAITFDVTADGRIDLSAYNQPSGVTCDDETYILTVVNCHVPVVTTTSVSVEKVWAGDDGLLRPSEITAVLLKNGEVADEVTLSEENDWSHRWSGLDDDYTWTVAEADVPAGYVSEVSQSGRKFTITNTYDASVTTDGEEPTEELPDGNIPLDGAPTVEELPEEDIPLGDVPATGDMGLVWMAMAALSGSGLAGMKLLGRKRRDEE